MISISFTTKSLLLENKYEPSDFTEAFIGAIHYLDDNTGTEASDPIGYINISVCNMGQAQENGHSAFDVLDSVDDEIAKTTQLFNGDGELTQKALIALKSESYFGITKFIYINLISLDYSAKGKEIGLKAIQHSIDLLGDGCDFIALSPCPLQFNEDESYNSYKNLKVGYPKKNEKAAKAKLIKHYQKMDFQLVEGTDLMLLPLHQYQL